MCSVIMHYIVRIIMAQIYVVAPEASSLGAPPHDQGLGRGRETSFASHHKTGPPAGHFHVPIK